MMRAENPGFQIREYEVNHGEVGLRLLVVPAEHKGVVPVAHVGQRVIALIPVRRDARPLGDVLGNEAGHMVGALVLDNAQAKPTRVDKFLGRDAALVSNRPLRGAVVGVLTGADLDGPNDRDLVVNAVPLAARSAADKALVDLYGVLPADGVTVGTDHPGAQFVKHGKSRLVGSDTELPLKLQRGLAGGLSSHQVRAPKPRRERHVRGLHDRAGRKGRVLFAGSAAKYNRGARPEAVGLAGYAALAASEAIGPAEGFEVFGARLVVGEEALKTGESRREGRFHSHNVAPEDRFVKQPDKHGKNRSR